MQLIPQSVCATSDKVSVPVYRLNTVIVGAGAAGMNCAVHLYEFMKAKGVEAPEDLIAIVTAGVGLGASRMSGSDKQTYYKMGTSPTVADSAMDFAKTLTAFGCMHGDVALAEGESSLREFFHLVQAGVPFPHDPEGAYIGYKTDHDPFERATSAGPKTSKFMSECLQVQSDRYGIQIFDKQEAAHLLTSGVGDERRIIGIVTIDKNRLLVSGKGFPETTGAATSVSGKGFPETTATTTVDFGLTVFLCENMVLAAGGPGELYDVSVYPHGQTGMHGLALAAGLAAHNLTESQFGLASTKFRWNVSGTYMQVIPRIFSTGADGNDPKEFLAPYFPTTAKMATNIFLKGYQWPFDPQRILNHQSSLIDVLVHHETQVLGRRVFMDFTQNLIPGEGKEQFCLEDMEPEAFTYLERNHALQATPIERLEFMNPLAIDIYTENGIDIRTEPLEIAVCSQHNNGGFVVDKWWQSNIPHTFVVGEMAGTHGVKRPGGSALNAGQAGSMRAAEYIVNAYGSKPVSESALGDEQKAQLASLFDKLSAIGGKSPDEAIREIQRRMTLYGGHMRRLETAEKAAAEARDLYMGLRESFGTKSVSLSIGNISGALRDEKSVPKHTDAMELVQALRAEHMALAHLAFLEAVVEYLKAGGGSRGSFMALRDDGDEIHPNLIDPDTGKPYRFVPENEALRATIAEVRLAEPNKAAFAIRRVPVRPIPQRDDPFELAWTAYRTGKVFRK
ncbi:MAG: FAD-binding protein [Armatimonadota bacterium]|nr:FAD-binding protein [Armatimonadota bacterium]